MGKKQYLLWAGIMMAASLPIHAQRMQQELGRGVVAVQNGNNVLISWRKLVQEPENARYNVYCKRANGGSFTKLNQQPLSKTNFSSTTTSVPKGSQLAVAIVHNGTESALSEPYTITEHDVRGIFMEIDFDGFLPTTDYTTRFVWPADLDGDGEYDYVVDRLSTNGGSDKVEGYRRDGKRLWTIDMGPNVNICDGHNDMVTAYDIDGDGKAEVIMKTSDGTRFWDSKTNGWGKYLFHSDNADTDNDGITDYYKQSKRNPPQYITVIDGLTGEEKTSIEMTYPGYYNRDNKADYYQDGDYFCLQGHMGIFYPDGLHPAVVFEHMSRHQKYGHQYYVSAWAYEFNNGKAGDFKELFTQPAGGATFHQIRIADVDGDGRDEMLEGGYAMTGDGTTLFNAGISHGDRFHTGDIDPERPGLETFAIQQDAPDMLGQILYDAADGTAIKKWYMGGVGDVGRGMAMDVDPDHIGYELWSAMDGNVYDAKGEIIPGLATTWPTEGVWWDGALDREKLDSPDGSGYNPDVRKFNGSRLIEMGKLSGYTIKSENGKRPMFFGDIIGDWREELIFKRVYEDKGCVGIVGFSTDFETEESMYSLIQNPAYRLQCTTRSYYQSPFTDFYLGYDMPAPPLPPVMKADCIWQDGTVWQNGSGGFVDSNRSNRTTWSDGKSVMFDMSGNKTVDIQGTVCPDTVFAMIPKGQTLTWNGTGETGGETELWKSMGGKLIVNVPLKHKGNTYISEGTLEINSEINDTLHIRARGTLAGTGRIKGDVVFEGALNYEGCRIQPGNENAVVGKLTFDKNLNLNAKVYLEMTLDSIENPVSDEIAVNGDIHFASPVIMRFMPERNEASPGTYKLISWTGNASGLPESGRIPAETIKVEGLEGYSYILERTGNTITLTINEQRGPSANVIWTGEESGTLNYSASNFILDGQPTAFVAGDSIIFNDDASVKDVTLNEQLPVGDILFTSDENYSLNGEGGFSGKGGLTKKGNGTLEINGSKHSFTGSVNLEGGKVKIKQLGEGGEASSLGAATATAGNWTMKDTELEISATNTSTDRPLTIEDTVTMNIPSGLTALKGIIDGEGILVKDGKGQLNLNYPGANKYKETILKDGVLAMGAWNTTFGRAGSKLTAYAGTLKIFDNNSSSTAPVFNYQLEIPEDAKVTLQGGSRCRLTGKLTGKGTIYYTTPYVRADWQMNMSSFNGTFHALGSQMRLNQATDMSKTSLVLNDKVLLVHTKAGSGTEVNLTTKIGSLASTSKECTVGRGTYEIGYNNESTTYAGLFANTAVVKKYGEGTLTLTNKQPIGFSVYGGTLFLNSEGSSEGTIQVYNGGCLSGNGTANNVTVYEGGSIAAEKSEYLRGSMQINGQLTVNEGGCIHVRKQGNYIDYFEVEGDVTLKSPIIEMEYRRGEYKDGDSYELFKTFKSIKLTGNVQMSPEKPGEGLEWDLASFTTDGTIKVKADATGIESAEAETMKVWPNPVEDECNVSAGQETNKNRTVVVQDLSGRILLTQKMADNICTLHLGEYPQGLYIISIQSEGRIEAKCKVVKR